MSGVAGRAIRGLAAARRWDDVGSTRGGATPTCVCARGAAGMRLLDGARGAAGAGGFVGAAGRGFRGSGSGATGAGGVARAAVSFGPDSGAGGRSVSLTPLATAGSSGPRCASVAASG
jgi:hypothetical protein